MSQHRKLRGRPSTDYDTRRNNAVMERSSDVSNDATVVRPRQGSTATNIEQPRQEMRAAPSAIALSREWVAGWKTSLTGTIGRLRSVLRDILADHWLLGALAVALVAFGLRAVGATFGLPYHYHWDEPTIVNRAMRMGNGDFNPHFFYYPGLSFYVTFITEAGLYVAGHIVHTYPTVNAYATAYFTDSTPFYLLGRALGALIGSATVILCYLVGKRFFSPIIGVLASLLLAVSTVSVANGHFITNDVPMAFFVVLAYIWLWDVYARGRRRDYVLAGVAIGLGIATKYLPAVLLVSLTLAHIFRLHRETGRWWPKNRELGPLALGVGVALAMFFAASPYSVLDWRQAIHDYMTQGQLSSAAGSSSTPLNFLPYLTASLPWSIGWPAYLAALGGLVAIVSTRGERRLQLILLASFPVLYFLMIGSARQPWARWLVTLQPFLALSAAAIAWWCVTHAPSIWQRLAPRARINTAMLSGGAFTVVVLLLVAPPAVTSARYALYLTGTDPRTQAVQWFDAHVSPSTTVAVQPMFDRYFFTAPIMTESQLATLEQDIPASKVAVRETVDGYYRTHGVYRDVPFVYDISTLRADGVRYVVISSLEYHSSANVAAEDRFYADLTHKARLVARFAPSADLPDGDMYPVSMPTISIYALSPSTP